MRAYLGLGANVGNREANLRLALRWLAPACTVVVVSSLYRCDAIVLDDQPPGPDYLNAACAIDTDLSPKDLLRFVKQIEHDIGRRPAAKWAPRPIDIDILLYGNIMVDTQDLTIPHPRLAERSFVICPLAEIAPDAIHPRHHKTIAALAEDADFTGLEHLADPSWADSASPTLPS